jgi:serine/threonine-protein kinase RsbW
MQSLLVTGNLDSLSDIGHFVNAAAAQAGLDKKIAYRLRLAVDEIATNIIVHGYDEAGLTGDVLVIAEMDAQALTIVLEDTSPPFDPRNLGRPDQIDRPAEDRPIGGLGIYLTIENVDKFDYEFVENRNRNIFVVNRPQLA